MPDRVASRLRQSRLAGAVFAALVATGACDIGIPVDLSGSPGSGVPPIPPGALFSFTSDERAVQLGDTLVISVMDATGAVWSVNDTTVASVAGDELGAVLRPRRLGVVRVSVRSRGVTLTRAFEVVRSLCRPAAVTAPIAVGLDSALTFGEEDCALAYLPWFTEWPRDSTGPLYPTLRAKGLRLVLDQSTLVRVDAVSSAANPLLAIADSTGSVLTMRRNPWERAFVARMLAPGRYVLWVAIEPDRPSAPLALQVRAVVPCSETTAVIRPITLGTPVEGTLDAADCHSPWGPAQEWWRVTLPRDGHYRITIEATATAAYLSPQVFHRGGYVSELPTLWPAGEYILEASGLSDVGYRLRVVACATATACP